MPRLAESWKCFREWTLQKSFNGMKKLSILAACYGVLTLASLGSISDWPTRLHALAMIETGCTSEAQQQGDFKIGPSKEVSRYQLLPSVWRIAKREAGLSEAKTTDPKEAKQVALFLWKQRVAAFKKIMKREPDNFELYVLWNAPGVFYTGEYRYHLVPLAVRERAIRFSNLVEDMSNE